ncbi:MAG: acyloxyacyl hydrolase [Paludibacter sp.]|nr:acyloxyacyl hydrolase [Paludibacter sp.]
MKKSICKLIFLFSIVYISANGQGLHNYSFKVEGLFGSILKHDNHLTNLVKGGTTGLSLNVEWQTDGSSMWHQYFNFPAIGFSATYINLGNSQMLGQLISAYPYLQIPLVRSEGIQVNIKPGAGLAFITKYYGNTPHIAGTLDREIIDSEGNSQIIEYGANSAIGSMMNVFLNLGVNAEYTFTEDFSLSLGVAWQHASNGSIVKPNSGINMINAYLGFAYIPNSEMIKVVHRGLMDDIPRRIYVETAVSGGVRQLDWRDGKSYPIASLNVGAYYPLSNIYKMGLGADLFFDGVYGYENAPVKDERKYNFTYIEKNNFANKLRAGISWRHELIFGNLVAGIHLGLYLFNPVKNLEPYDKVQANGGNPLKKGVFYKYNIEEEDGWFYTRIVGKYYFSNNIFASIGLKTHLQKAEFIEWGLGYRF